MRDIDSSTLYIAQRVEEEIASFRVAHQQIMSALQGLEVTLTPEQAEAYARLRDTALASYHDTRLMGALLEKIAEYNKRLVAQRQSSRDMFIAGGKAMVADLLAMIMEPEYAQLRHLIEQMAHQDDLSF